MLTGAMRHYATRTVALTARPRPQSLAQTSSARITRPFHSTVRSAAQETTQPAPARVPRPIPLDIGAGAASAPATSASASAAAPSPAGRRQEGGFFYKYGSPIFTIAVFGSASTLAMHILYHHLALEEYQLASAQKIQQLEIEISELKAQQSSRHTVRHPPGGRGEFV
ncbi:hypothetical protein BGZ73_000090 [Actinomortierella ambigua]|nr:hypothetical protein BGZ73_000090 [Actinomortierella ambigua]